MPTITTDHLAAHAQAIKDRESAQTAGVRAAAMRRINQLELELTLTDTEFTPYQPPTQAAQSFAAWTDAECVAKHAQLIAERRAATSPGKKAAGTTAVKRVESELEKRGIKFERASFANRSPSAVLDDESLLRRVHKVRALIARDDIRPAIKATAERELRHLTDLAAERDLSVSNTVTAPQTDAGAALDKVTDQVAAQVRKGRKTTR